MSIFRSRTAQQDRAVAREGLERHAVHAVTSDSFVLYCKLSRQGRARIDDEATFTALLVIGIHRISAPINFARLAETTRPGDFCPSPFRARRSKTSRPRRRTGGLIAEVMVEKNLARRRTASARSVISSRSAGNFRQSRCGLRASAAAFSSRLPSPRHKRADFAHPARRPRRVTKSIAPVLASPCPVFDVEPGQALFVDLVRTDVGHMHAGESHSARMVDIPCCRCRTPRCRRDNRCLSAASPVRPLMPRSFDIAFRKASRLAGVD